MAGQDGRDDEIDALLDGINVDSAKIQEQITQKRGGKPPEQKPDEKKPEEKKPEEKKPEEHKSEVPDPEAIRTAMLHEMWGDQFASVEDFKKANIPAALQERETLRRRNEELETQVKAKPKHAFATDELAMLNEFTRETGIKDVGVFGKLHSTEVANMDAMDALILQRIIDDPSLAGKEPQVRRMLEKRYNVDSKKVEAGEMTQEDLDDNLLEVSSDGRKAKEKLLGLKAKIKMPEPEAEVIPQGKKWTPEIEATQKANWQKVSEKMGDTFATIPILMEGAKEPIANFVLPEDVKKVINKNALDFVINNQMEVNEANVRNVAMQMYSDAVLPNFDKIVKIVFDRARSMTEEEFLKTYSNPSEKNKDQPDLKDQPLSDEAKAEKAFNAEMTR
jgi:hypothetical protein